MAVGRRLRRAVGQWVSLLLAFPLRLRGPLLLLLPLLPLPLLLLALLARRILDLDTLVRRQRALDRPRAGASRRPRASCCAGFSFAFFSLPTPLLMFAGFLFQIAGTDFLFARRSARPISNSSVRM